MAAGYEKLRALGTDRHRVAEKEGAPSERGQEPESESESRGQFEHFRYSLFGAGACVPLDVLAAANEVIKLESQEHRHTQPGASPVPARDGGSGR